MSRNAPCPCGSGKKHKHCCLGRTAPKRGAVAGTGGPGPMLTAAAEAHRAGQPGRAIPLYRRSLAAEGPRVDALAGLGQALAEVGAIPEAAEALGKAVRLDPRNADLHVALSSLLSLDRRLDEGLVHAERAVALRPGSAAAQIALGNCLERRNRIEEATAAARRALAAAPNEPRALLLLATLERRGGDEEAARQRLERLIGRRDVDPITRQVATSQLAFALDRLGRPEEAWARFVEHGRLVAADPAARRIDRKAFPGIVAGYRAVAEAGTAPRFAAGALADDRRPPLFLLGFSRSGTTMTEQILAAHPEVVTTDEYPLIRNVRRLAIARLGGTTWDPAMLARFDLELCRALRAQFRAEAERIFAPGKDRLLVSKCPLDLVDLPLIDLLFPDSRAIVVQRDPHDVCLSCFQQDFAINASNVHFLDFADTVALCEQVLDAWIAVRPTIAIPVLEVRYEDVVDDLEREARSMLEHAGLPWDPAVLEFWRQGRDRAITTPSYAAVTRPVSRKAIGRWQAYAGQMAPWLDRLAALRDRVMPPREPAGDSRTDRG